MSWVAKLVVDLVIAARLREVDELRQARGERSVRRVWLMVGLAEVFIIGEADGNTLGRGATPVDATLRALKYARARFDAMPRGWN